MPEPSLTNRGFGWLTFTPPPSSGSWLVCVYIVPSLATGFVATEQARPTVVVSHPPTRDLLARARAARDLLCLLRINPFDIVKSCLLMVDLYHALLVHI